MTSREKGKRWEWRRNGEEERVLILSAITQIIQLLWICNTLQSIVLLRFFSTNSDYIFEKKVHSEANKTMRIKQSTTQQEMTKLGNNNNLNNSVIIYYFFSSMGIGLKWNETSPSTIWVCKRRSMILLKFNKLTIAWIFFSFNWVGRMK